MLKSKPDRYGTVAVSIHWLSAIQIPALLGSGFQAANAMDTATKAGFLRFHIPVAINRERLGRNRQLRATRLRER